MTFCQRQINVDEKKISGYQGLDWREGMMRQSTEGFLEKSNYCLLLFYYHDVCMSLDICPNS